MPSNYKEICCDNIRRRGEEFDDIGRLISEQLYSNRTHFIYELLQNAEDALGRHHQNNSENGLPDSVKFILYKDRLEFRHFGEDFNTDDVKGITDVLKGTKAEDRSQIGKFGIGFKSVYAFTSTPEIHSRDEHFIIERYIRPRNADRIPKMADGETVFIFPFNHKDLSKERAFQLIEEKLKKIGSRVLLFLKNISEIEWEIDGQDKGLYLKESKLCGRLAKKVAVIGQPGNEDEEEEWLVFGRSIDIPNSSNKSSIEVAFRLIEDEKTKKPIIRNIKSSPLVVYFPTKLETQLGFLVQGPYDTTASRSDIEDNEWNRSLIKETAILLTERVLLVLKEMELLTVSLLEALPIKVDDFPENSIFRPIYDKCRATLRDQDLLPTANDKYVAGKYALLARAEDLVHLLNSKQLSFLLDNSQKLEWLTIEITETRKDIHRYLVGWKPSYWETGEEMEPLIVAEIRPEDMIEKLTTDFLKEQSIQWLLKLYAFLEKRPGLISRLSNKPIIRLQDGTYVPAFKEDGSPNAYLPPENGTEFPVVSREITKDEKALEFLKRLPLTEPDAVAEVIERIIPKYTQDNPQISDDEHLRDMKKILHAYSTDSQEKRRQLISKLEATTLVRAENLVLNQIEYKELGELYFRSEELLLYFDGNKDAWFVSSEYDACFCDLFKDLGVDDVAYIERKMPRWNRHVVIGNSHGWHKRGLNGFDPDIDVDGLEYALTHPMIEKSAFVWNLIAIPNADCIRGIIESSSRQTYENSDQEEQVSEKFGRLLIDTPWLPDKQGNFHKPGELKLDDLQESFERDEKLANQLSMKKDIVAKLAEAAGISQNTFKLAQELEKQPPDIRKKIESLLQEQDRKQPEFPQRSSVDPERRQERLAEQMNEGPEKEYEQRNRSVRTTISKIDPQTYLKEMYTNDAGQMICQICKKEMPFRKRDGEYYFEAVEALSKDHFAKEHEAQFLALCPLCAARYNEFVKHDEGAMESLKNALMNSEDAEVSLQLGELDTSIRFIKSHFLDIRTIIEAQG